MEAAELGKKERRRLNFWVYCHHCGWFGEQRFQGIETEWGKDYYVFRCRWSGGCNEEILIPRDTLASVVDGAEAAA